jgi:hypothetical protein
MGAILGLFGWFFKFIQGSKYIMQCKATFCILGAAALVIIGEQKFMINGSQQNLSNSKYIACLIFGYTLFQVWGNHKPINQIAYVWFFI